MTTSMGVPQRYDLNGTEFRFIGTKDHPIVEITKKNEGDQESTLTIDPSQISPKNQVAFLKLCRQYHAEETESIVKKIEECKDMVRDCSQMLAGYGTSTISSVSPVTEENHVTPRAGTTSANRCEQNNRPGSSFNKFIENVVSNLKDFFFRFLNYMKKVFCNRGGN